MRRFCDLISQIIHHSHTISGNSKLTKTFFLATKTTRKRCRRDPASDVLCVLAADRATLISDSYRAKGAVLQLKRTIRHLAGSRRPTLPRVFVAKRSFL